MEQPMLQVGFAKIVPVGQSDRRRPQVGLAAGQGVAELNGFAVEILDVLQWLSQTGLAGSSNACQPNNGPGLPCFTKDKRDLV